MRSSKKLIAIVKLSARSQLTSDRNEKVALLIEMLETIAKGTKYKADVMDAINDYYKGTAFEHKEGKQS
ncbi:hypothetical protein FLT15_17830 [Paenibacillus thiaminolyticus]|uniref:hypothetical protein n=1 Tax=Paenibacillus thiaminolyticus TaxID=49283 RepID=UPI001162215C|nr:hypothetical protein [Paenibacillus thiaminolyticus]NGP60117.1 hypothetical protein [Paenibacillus thiaminolyticus]